MTSTGDRSPTAVADLADLIAAAVTKCPDVAGLGQVPGIPVATYLPGRTVSGVAVRADEVEVSVVAKYGLPLQQIADEVRQAVAPLVPGRVVDVVIADITAPEAQPAAEMEPAGRHLAN
jgi:hypothetical protein